MNLETCLSNSFWEEIKSSYSDKHYKAAILEAIMYLSNIIREKTGLECDGISLAGQAFGGINPKLKINRFQSTSDVDEQKGIEHILRGIYSGIRNPRSHEKRSDNKEDADAIILFIDYLIRIINKSKAPFTKEDYLERVFDPNFPKVCRYAEILVNQIPTKQRHDIFLEVLRRKEQGNGETLTLFFKKLYLLLSEDEKNDVNKIISEELSSSNEISTIRTIIQIFASDLWSQFNESSRIRIEAMLINDIKEGKYNPSNSKHYGGVFGTWALRLLNQSVLKTDFLNVLSNKLKSTNQMEQNYVFKNFFYKLPILADEPGFWISRTIENGLKNGDIRFYDGVFSFCSHEKWYNKFKDLMENFEESKPTGEIVDDNDDLPF